VPPPSLTPCGTALRSCLQRAVRRHDRTMRGHHPPSCSSQW
jgi:hypothetical protein